jgi:hypothetical protein
MKSITITAIHMFYAVRLMPCAIFKGEHPCPR